MTAHFLVSKFGTGSAYVDAGSADPDVSFVDPDPTVTFNAADVGPITAGPVHWHLNADRLDAPLPRGRDHGPNDPFVPPSLVGNTPGWPTTDLRVINDNNKAQRNMGLSTTPARGVGRVRLLLRDRPQRGDVPCATSSSATAPDAAVLKELKGAAIEVVGGKGTGLERSGVLRLAGMQPGENRWIGLRFPAAAGKAGQVLAVHFHELVDGVPVNGFAVGARLMPLEAVIHEKLQRHRSQLTRLAASGVAGAEKSADEAAKLAEEQDGRARGVREVRLRPAARARSRHRVGRRRRGAASTSPARSKSLEKAIKADDAGAVAVSHDCLLNRLDSALTMQHIAGGDVANILHNVAGSRICSGRARSSAASSAGASWRRQARRSSRPTGRGSGRTATTRSSCAPSSSACS